MKMLNKIIGGSSIAIAAVLAFSASTTQAQLVNGGFDTAAFTANPISFSSGPGGTSGVGQGWAMFGSVVTNMARSPDSPLSNPDALLVRQTAGTAWAANGAYQIVSITPGQQYTYTMSMLSDTGWGTYTTPVDISLSFLNASLKTNGLVWGAGSVGGFLAANTPTAIDRWTLSSVTSTAPAGAAYAIMYAMFMENGAQTSQLNMYFDNGSLVATPEPASLALVGMGLASFYLIRRRKS
jgi:hypothetical protein